ncbi:MAG TPA: ice-binding family protein [Baekduia sp.]
MKRVLAALAIGAIGVFGLGAASASASSTHLDLGGAESFAVLGGTTVMNTGPTVVNGDLGTSPASSVIGFPPGIVTGGTHRADATAVQAQADLTTALGTAADMPCDTTFPSGHDFGGTTVTPGVTCVTGPAQLIGTLTLDHQGDPNAFFLFKIAGTLTTADASSVGVANAGDETCAPNTTWRVMSSATLGSFSDFTGDVLAGTSITAGNSASTTGRLLARSSGVGLVTNTVSACPTPPSSADVSIDATGSPDAVAPGDTITYAITATNDGPDDASDGLMTASLPAGVDFTSLTAPDGWTCNLPDVDTTGEVSCTTPSMAIGTADFTLAAKADPGVAADETVALPVAVSSTTADPDSEDQTTNVYTLIAVPDAVAPIDAPAVTPPGTPEATPPVVPPANPAPTSCRSARQFTLHLKSLGRAARGARVVKANLVSAKGFRLRKLLVKLTQVHVDLRGLSRGRVTVHVTIRKHSGKNAVISRTYTTCTLPRLP